VRRPDARNRDSAWSKRGFFLRWTWVADRSVVRANADEMRAKERADRPGNQETIAPSVRPTEPGAPMRSQCLIGRRSRRGLATSSCTATPLSPSRQRHASLQAFMPCSCAEPHLAQPALPFAGVFFALRSRDQRTCRSHAFAGVSMPLQACFATGGRRLRRAVPSGSYSHR